MGNQISTADATVHQHETMSLSHAVETLRAVPHMQQGSLNLQYSSPSHVALSLKLKLDAPAPCRVSIFMLASEDVDGSIDVAPALAVNYGPGYDQSFPGDQFQHVIHLCDIGKHMSPHGGKFPVVIRVESLTAAYSSYSLEALPPTAAALPHFVNAHTIFGKIELSSGSLRVEVLKQHLWLAGNPYNLPATSLLLQQQLRRDPRAATTLPKHPAMLKPSRSPALAGIHPAMAPLAHQQPQPYLISAAAMPQYQPYHNPVPTRAVPYQHNTSSPEHSRGARMMNPAVPACTVCRSRPVEVLSSPCFHACMCIPCAVQQRQHFNCCPICFQGMDDVVPIRAPQA